MKSRVLLILCLLLGSWAAMAQNGIIRGRVLDENSLAMPGANILLNGGEYGTASDAGGYFVFLNMPAGKYSLQITFIGYQGQTSEVELAAGQTANLSFQLTEAALLADEVIILGDRLKGQAKALNDQRNRANVTNIVAADQIGRFPDANVGDALKRVPGITMQNDQGEARDIIIRGLAPQLNSVTINGERIPSAEGDNRRVQLDLIPADMIQLIEVNKAITPDMDADAIGGSVNLVTRSAPSDFRLSGTLASGYNALSQKPIWTGAFIFGDRFFNNKLGVVLSTSYNNHNFGSDNIEAEWTEIDGVGTVMDEFQIRQYQVQRIRRSFSAGLDYQLNNRHSLRFNAMYNWRDDWESRYRYVVSDLGDAFENGDFTGADGQYSALATVERQTKGGIDSDRTKSKRLEDQRMMNFSLGGEHFLGSRFKMTWAANYSKASEERPNERYLQFVGEYEEAEDGNPAEGIPVTIDLRDPRKPFAMSAEEAQYRSLELDELTEEFQYTQEENYSGKIDFQYTIGKVGVLKAGFLYRAKRKERENTFSEYTPTGGANSGDAHPDFGGEWDADDEEFGDLELGNVPTENLSNSGFLAGNRYQIGHFATGGFLGGLDLANGSLYEGEVKQDEFITDNYTAEENVTAAYLMADLQLTSKLSTVFGVRMEHTDLSYAGFSFDEEEEELFGEVTGGNSYTNVLPSIHLKYDLSKSSVLRFAWTNALARPNYFDLVPYQAFNSDDRELVEGNSSLNPYSAMNFDLMLENYFQSVGLVSVGAFHKNISDFIYQRTFNNFDHPTFGEVDYTTFQNGTSAQVYGAEVALQRQLDFLPGIWRGLGVYVNYTYTQSETKGIEGRQDEGIALPGTANHMFNGSLSFETKKLVLRLSANYASDYIDELGGEAFEDRYYDKQFFLDFNGSYAFKNNWRLFVEMNNLTNQPLRYYQGISSRTMQEEFYNLRVNVGLKFDIFGAKQ
jgi:TonB-dependent receptor